MGTNSVTDGLRAAVDEAVLKLVQPDGPTGAWGPTYKGETVLLFDEYRTALDALCARADEAEALAAALRDYERWEADVILDGECWAPDGEAPLPRLTQELWDRLIVLQGKRNAALARYDQRGGGT